MSDNNNPTNENAAVSNDAWVDELIAWGIALEEEYEMEDFIPRNKEDLLNLTELNLSDFGLKTIPESIGNLTNLTVLDLSFNDLNTLPKSIGNLKNLNVLDLRENNVHSKYALPESVGQLISRLNLRCFDDEDMDADYFKSEFHSY